MIARAWRRLPTNLRDAVLLIAIALSACLLAGDHGAFGSSARYDEAAREMVELGDWSVPSLGYVPYGEKPILVYWLGAASRAWFGTSNRALHLTSVFACLLSVLSTFAMGASWRGRGFGLACALLLLGSGHFLTLATVPGPDPLLAAWMALAWLALARCVVRSEGATPRSGWRWLFWCVLGLGVLTKGPIALLLPGFAVAAYSLAIGGMRGAWRIVRALAPARGAAIVVAINLPWTWLAWRRDPRLLEFFYVDINFKSFTSGTFNHPGPWWYYVPVAAAMLAPFSLVALPLIVQQVARTKRLVAAARGLVDDDARRDARMRLLLLGIVVPSFLFLSASVSKLLGYLLPLLPPMVLLFVAPIWERQRASKSTAALLVASAVLLLTLVVALPLAWYVLRTRIVAGEAVALGRFAFTSHDLDPVALGGAAVAACALGLAVAAAASVAALVAAVRHDPRRSLFCLAASMVAIVITLEPRAERLLADFSGDRLAAVVLEREARPIDGGSRDPVLVDHPTIHNYAFLLRLARPAAIWGDARELGLGHFLVSTPPGTPMPAHGRSIDDPYHVNGDNTVDPWLWSDARVAAEWGGTRRVWFFTDSKGEAHLRKLGLKSFRIDSARELLLLSNRDD